MARTGLRVNILGRGIFDGDEPDLDRLAKTFNVTVEWLKAAMGSDAEVGRAMAKLSKAERLARAVLMFFEAGEWTREKRVMWTALTGSVEASSKVLGDLAREVRAEEEQK